MSYQIRRARQALPAAIAAAASIAALATSLLTAQPAAAGDSKPAGPPTGAARLAQLTTDPVPAGFASWLEVARVQAGLHDAAIRISDAADAAGGDQLGSITANPLERAVRVYWKGAMPAPVSALIGRLRQQVAIRVLPAAYGEQQLLAEELRLAHQKQAAGRFAEIAPLADASGLEVTMRAAAGPAGAAAAAPASSVRLVVRTGPAPAATFDRYHDTSPYWGGAAYNVNGGVCSTGFAVRHNGTNKLLTAGHCAENGDLAITGDALHSSSFFLGEVAAKNAQRDYELIDPSLAPTNPGSSAGSIYIGTFSSATAPFTDAVNMPVGGAERSVLEELVFTDGALSGFRPNIKVTKVNSVEFIPVNGVLQLMSPMIVASRQDGQNAVGNGDSGGPVGVFSADGSHVIARGTNTAGVLGSATCTGVPASTTRSCSSTVVFAPITGSLGTLSGSASIITA